MHSHRSTPFSGAPAARAGLAHTLVCSLLLSLALVAHPAVRAQATAAVKLKPVTVADGLVNPWSLAFLPDGRMLVTERPGRLRVVAPDGKLSPPVAGLPAVAATGQCGLLEVLPDPKFAENGWLYWSYAEPGERGEGNGTAVARGKFDGSRVSQVQVIFRQLPKVESSAHCGGRLVVARDGQLFVTLGERFSRKDDAQKLDNHLGKVVRISPDGLVPADNPFVKTAGAKPEIWSYGHRNVQGAALHPGTGELWTQEHGPQGGDEVNIDRAGLNYGWPVITYGRNYGTGTRIGEGSEKAGVEPPVHRWAPISIAPSGMAFVTGERYPGWRGSLVVGALRAEALVRLTLDGNRVTGEERLLANLHERIRDVRQGPDGWLYVVTDNANGRVLRLER